jgi:hypothetical protein
MPDSSEAYRLECEVNTWKRMIRKNGRGWWDLTKKRILQKRGQGGLDYLLKAMNKPTGE